MPPRRQTVEKFTQFLDDRYHWQSSGKLRSNMQKLVNLNPDRDEAFWLNYFLAQVREGTNSLARHHLQAYAEEICYTSAKLVRAKFQDSSSLLEDYFQQARGIVGDGSRFWRRYNTDLGNPGSYGKRKLYQILVENIFTTRQDRPTSRYGLLIRVTKKRMGDALIALPEAQRSQYLAIWTYLKEIQACLPRVKSVIQEPTLEQLGEISQRYKAWRGISLSREQVKDILEICIDALYRQRPRQDISYDELLDSGKGDRENNFEVAGGDGVEEIEVDDPELSIFQVVDQSTIVADLLREVIATFDREGKPLTSVRAAGATEKLLVLNYGLVEVNQTLIGEIFGVKQFNVSRQLTRVRGYLIKDLVRVAKEKPEINLDVDYIDNLGEGMEDLLIWYCRDQVLYKELENAVRSHLPIRSNTSTLAVYFSNLKQDCAEKLLKKDLAPAELDKRINKALEKLKLLCGEAARKLKISDQELLERIDSIVSEFVSYFSEAFRNRFDLSVEIISKIKDCLVRAIHIFLINVRYEALTIN